MCGSIRAAAWTASNVLMIAEGVGNAGDSSIVRLSSIEFPTGIWWARIKILGSELMACQKTGE